LVAYTFCIRRRLTKKPPSSTPDASSAILAVTLSGTIRELAHNAMTRVMPDREAIPMSHPHVTVALRASLLIASFWSATAVQAQSASSPLVSTYAPVADLESEVKTYLDRIAADVADKDGYGEDQRGRVSKDASTVAVLGLMLGMHDQENRQKKSAAALVELAVELAGGVEDIEGARTTLGKIKAAWENPSAGEPITWKPVADLALLMQQVPNVNNALRRGVTSGRFERSIDRTAGHAVTLAAIAQASLLDTTYCGDEDDEQAWRKICADMRDAAADVYRAVRKKDQEAAKAGLERIVATCDACHHRFRD
jgi:hypothetical protein